MALVKDEYTTIVSNSNGVNFNSTNELENIFGKKFQTPTE